MNESADLSIIIVSYNTMRMLDDCLASIYAGQGELRLEIWVVDNRSLDGSVEMVQQKYPQVKLIANTSNRGFAPANNQALREATGEFLLLLNSDTLILDDVLTASVHYLKKHTQTGALGCRVLNPDRTLQLTCFRWPSLFTIFITATGLSILPVPKLHGYERIAHWRRDSQREVDSITGCYLMTRRSALAQIGLLDEDFFFYGEETDWCRRARRGGWKIEFAPVGEIIHYGGASGNNLGWKRKLMLVTAIVRLQRKHCGLLNAVIAYLLLFFREVLRAAGFFAAAMVWPQKFRQRSSDSWAAVWHFRGSWPTRSKQIEFTLPS